MALEVGTKEATAGLSRALFTAMSATLLPVLKAQNMNPKDIEKIKEGWRNLSYALAVGMVSGLRKGDPPGDSYAEIASSKGEDAVFWAWVSGLMAAFKDWKPSTGPEQALQVSLAKLTAPTSLKGILR